MVCASPTVLNFSTSDEFGDTCENHLIVLRSDEDVGDPPA